MAGAPIGHAFVPGPAPFIATGLFFVGIGAVAGAWWLFTHHPGRSSRGSSRP